MNLTLLCYQILLGEDYLIEDISLEAINGYINYLPDEREVKVSDLDLHNRMIYLRDTNPHKPQTIYLSQSIIKILNEWLEITQLNGDRPLFPSVYGEELNARSLKTILERMHVQEEWKQVYIFYVTPMLVTL